MTAPKSAYDSSQGSPNLGVIQYLQDNWTPDDINSTLHIVKTNINADATGGIAVDIPVSAEIIDAWVVCTSANASGTMKVQTAGTVAHDVTDAMICAVNKVVVKAGTIDDDYNIVSEDGIQIVSHAAADRGFVFIAYMI